MGQLPKGAVKLIETMDDVANLKIEDFKSEQKKITKILINEKK